MCGTSLPMVAAAVMFAAKMTRKRASAGMPNGILGSHTARGEGNETVAEVTQPCVRLHEVGRAVQDVAEAAGFSVVREYVGHAIGTAMHEEPQVPNYWPGNPGPKLKAGNVFAVEPMVNAGGAGTRLLGDGWSVVTADGRRSAHFEHTIAITEEGPEVLTVP